MDIFFKIRHELNNPLGIIANYLQIIRNSDKIDDIHKNIKVIQNQFIRVKRIISHSLENSSDIHYENLCNINEIIQKTVTLLHHRCDTSHIKITYDVNATFEMSIDPDLLTQLLLNICMNALESIETEGFIHICAKETEKNGTSYGVFEIIDSGIGIPEKHKSNIFIPFFSTKGGDENRGLGLSISKDIVEKLGGTIDFITSPGEGTTFYVSIPKQKSSVR